MLTGDSDGKMTRSGNCRYASVVVGRGNMGHGDIVDPVPNTKKPVPTGLSTASVILRSLPNMAMILACPSCGKSHKWRPRKA